MRAFFAALLLGSLAAVPVHAQSMIARVDTTESLIDYTGSAFLHDWTGTSRNVEGRLALDVDEPSRSTVEIRATVASFDSGNKRRDRNMRDVTEADTYRYVRFRSTSIAPKQWGRTQDGYAGIWTVVGDLTFHGQTHPVEAEVKVRIEGESVTARARFPVSLERFGIDRPALAWIAPISDTIQIDAQIEAEPYGRAPDRYRVSSTRTDDGTRVVKSEETRPIWSDDFAATQAGFEAIYRKADGAAPSWQLAVVSTGTSAMSTTDQVRLEVDGKFLQPLRIDNSRETRPDGQPVVRRSMVFSASIFEQISQADRVVVEVGPRRYRLPYIVRADLRTLVDRHGEG